MGQLQDLIEVNKKHVVIMGEDPASPQVKYSMELWSRHVYFSWRTRPRRLSTFCRRSTNRFITHRNSPGYRLILNNILFPAARKKERKT